MKIQIFYLCKGNDTRQKHFVFTANGAVRMRLSKDDRRLLAEITERAVQTNNLIGRANVRNGLYVQDFGRSEEVKWLLELDLATWQNNKHLSSSTVLIFLETFLP